MEKREHPAVLRGVEEELDQARCRRPGTKPRWGRRKHEQDDISDADLDRARDTIRDRVRFAGRKYAPPLSRVDWRFDGDSHPYCVSGRCYRTLYGAMAVCRKYGLPLSWIWKDRRRVFAVKTRDRYD